jgi:hypothetical protein
MSILKSTSLFCLSSALALAASAAHAQHTTPTTPSKVQFSGYLQLRFDTLRGPSGAFNQAGTGGTGQRPTVSGPIVGGPSSGFFARRVRFKAVGPVNPNNDKGDTFTFQLDAPSTGAMNVRDAFVDLKTNLPKGTVVRVGQFPPDFTWAIPNSSRTRENPDRPMIVGDTNYTNSVFKTSVASTGGQVTPGSVLSLFQNQDREVGAQVMLPKRAVTKNTEGRYSIGLFNGEGREPTGTRNNGNVTLTARAEFSEGTGKKRKEGTLLYGASVYRGKYSVRGAAPVGTSVSPFAEANRNFVAADVRYTNKQGLELRAEAISGQFEVSPDRALLVKGNNVRGYYGTVRKTIQPHIDAAVVYESFNPTSKTVAGISPADYARKTLQFGVLRDLAPGTRLRLWYVQGLSVYDPAAAVNSPFRKKIGQFVSEIQIAY